MSTLNFILDTGRRLRQGLLGHRVVFHHVPKCAGTSVSRALRIRYALSEASIAAPATVDIVRARSSYENGTFEQRLNELRQLRTSLLHYFLWKDYYFVGGHVPFSSTVHAAFRSTYKFITVLRAPEDRFISQYFFNLNREHHAKVTLPLEEYLETPDAWVTANRYTEYFSGDEALKVGPGCEQVTKAIQNLQAFDLVGFTDRMGDFTKGLKGVLGISTSFKKERAAAISTSDRRKSISAAVRSKIDELCAADRTIFDAVRRHWAPD